MEDNCSLPSKIKAVATDIDATITDRRRRIDLGAIGTIRRLTSFGIPVILASGNAYPVVMYLAKFIGLDTPVVAENGGVVSWEKKKIIETLGERAAARKFMQILEEKYSLVHLTSDAWRKSEYVLERNFNLSEARELARKFHLKIEDTKFAYHVSELHVRKLGGLERALELMGIDFSNVLAIGDSQNDVEMMEKSAMAGAVGNATPEVKQVANYVSPMDFGDGFVDIIEHFFPHL